MLMVNHLIGFGGGGSSPASVAYQANAVLGTFTTFTYTGIAIGTASATRYVVVGLTSISSAATTITSVTIGGVLATNVITQKKDNGGVDIVQAFYIAAVPTGTTANVVVVYSVSQYRAGCATWSLDNLLSATATATASNTADPANASIDVAAGGVLLGFGAQSNSSCTYTWTNLTEVFDYNGGADNITMSGASAAFAAAQTALSVTCDPSSVGGTGDIMILAAFR